MMTDCLTTNACLFVAVLLPGQWYEEPNGAKYLCKKNTFNDFVDVARHLIDTKKLTSAEQLSCEGRSAGGMLIGSTINQAPELFKVAILGVPFVDVCCTMIDASIPLTTNEWEEVRAVAKSWKSQLHRCCFQASFSTVSSLQK